MIVIFICVATIKTLFVCMSVYGKTTFFSDDYTSLGDTTGWMTHDHCVSLQPPLTYKLLNSRRAELN